MTEKGVIVHGLMNTSTHLTFVAKTSTMVSTD